MRVRHGISESLVLTAKDGGIAGMGDRGGWDGMGGVFSSMLCACEIIMYILIAAL